MFDFPYVIIIPYAVLLVIYLIFEQKHKFITATVLKLCLSCTFTFIAWCSVACQSSFQPFFILAAIGLSFSIIGDFFTQYIVLDKRKFKLGMLFFSFTQICLIISYFFISPISFVEFIIFAVLLVIAMIFRKVQKWDTSDFRPMAEIYTLLVCFMAAKALSVFIVSGDGMLIAIGGILFFISDLLLVIWRFYLRKMCLAHLNWITYFTGQILIAFGLWTLLQ